MKHYSIPLPAASKNARYLYVRSALRESYIYKGRLHVGLTEKNYAPAIAAFLGQVERQTTRPRQLESKARIILAPASGVAEARIILRCPDGWTSDRFEEVALRAWAKNPWADIAIFHAVVAEEQMDVRFLDS